ncbi:arsinothricin resistance N-acetyltransferase ArsN1 family A [Chloroflexus aggregans]|uniref:GCN5-related N-acetyltransferase n=1 Tax=Chloroflexus aggregans (strain MD-66 / DSM 9485) TaxID=326427 RepID=B8G9K4_CHLAD|nr:arsinothricin resistance N-acetyltransferase ArsN1 family A [Chloroflexus aggregans]ACL26357.1 GCN5-related N-acetyltransferase [Chloroflexus aggregans DSM 9485]
MSNVLTRSATVADAEAIAAIYNQGIADRIATFETRPRTAEEVAGWFGDRFPIVVTIINDQIVAFAATFPYRPRDCYAGIAEFSVYVEREWRGRGIGRLTMLALIEAATHAGFWKLLSRVFVENTASRAMLASVGFREVGIYEKHARLDGHWRDVVIVERLITENLADGAV